MSLPVLRLRVEGYCSPVKCAISEEERIFGQAACQLQSIPIIWYRKVRPRGSNANADGDANSSKDPGVAQGELNQSPTRQKEEQDTDFSIPLFLKRQVTFLQSKTSPEANQKPNESTDGGSETYVRLDGVLNLCDTESGPAIELRSNSKEVEQILKSHDLADYYEKIDVMSDSFHGQEDDVKTSGPDNDDNKIDVILERIIPLEMINIVEKGGTWDLGNILNVGSGRLDCGIKVYRKAENYQLIGNGKKILLFDIADESKMTRDDAILYLNSLVEWNRSRLEYLSKVNDAEIGSTKTESYFPISWWC